jgi:hypothetical protein
MHDDHIAARPIRITARTDAILYEETATHKSCAENIVLVGDILPYRLLAACPKKNTYGPRVSQKKHKALSPG